MSNLNYYLSSDTWCEKEINALQRVIKSNRYTMGAEVKKFEEEFAEFNKEVASFKEKNEYFHPSAVLELKILEWFVQQDKVKQHIEEVKQYVAKIKSAKEKIKELQKEIDDITSECSLMNFNNKRLDCDASYTDNFNNIIDQTAEDRLEEEEPLDINNFDGHKNIIGLDESVEE